MYAKMTESPEIPESGLIGICRRSVPAEVVDRARMHLLDWLGCVIAARGADAARALARALPAEGDLLAMAFDPERADAQTAALATGALGNVLEMDDLHRASLLHAGDTVCAAALAVALRRPADGPALLGAIARGYECGTRIGMAAAAGGYTTFYNSGTCGVFGAAMAAADLAGLDADGMADALGQAGMQAAGVWQCRLEPTYSKQLATAHAARAGVLSAQLAAAGFPGARRILTGEMGFFASYYPGADRAALTREPRGAWAIANTSFKPFPACRHTHPAITAALELRAALAGAPPQAVEIATYGAAIDFCDRRHPETPDAARFSLQHSVAIALSRGAPRISDFEGEALTDPAVSELRDTVRLRLAHEIDAAFPVKYGAAVKITTPGWETLESRCQDAWGDPENPMSLDDLLTKFHANTAHGGVPQEASDRLSQAVLTLPEATDLGALADALGAALAPIMETA